MGMKLPRGQKPAVSLDVTVDIKQNLPPVVPDNRERDLRGAQVWSRWRWKRTLNIKNCGEYKKKISACHWDLGSNSQGSVLLPFTWADLTTGTWWLPVKEGGGRKTQTVDVAKSHWWAWGSFLWFSPQKFAFLIMFGLAQYWKLVVLPRVALKLNCRGSWLRSMPFGNKESKGQTASGIEKGDKRASVRVKAEHRCF